MKRGLNTKQLFYLGINYAGTMQISVITSHPSCLKFNEFQTKKNNMEIKHLWLEWIEIGGHQLIILAPVCYVSQTVKLKYNSRGISLDSQNPKYKNACVQLISLQPYI